jgi:hypothetical protein
MASNLLIKSLLPSLFQREEYCPSWKNVTHVHRSFCYLCHYVVPTYNPSLEKRGWGDFNKFNYSLLLKEYYLRTGFTEDDPRC